MRLIIRLYEYWEDNCKFASSPSFLCNINNHIEWCSAKRNCSGAQLIDTILPKVLAPLLMEGLTTLVIYMSTNLNV